MPVVRYCHSRIREKADVNEELRFECPDPACDKPFDEPDQCTPELWNVVISPFLCLDSFPISLTLNDVKECEDMDRRDWLLFPRRNRTQFYEYERHLIPLCPEKLIRLLGEEFGR